MSSAPSIRELFSGLDLAQIQEFKERRRQEDLHLDFKAIGERGLGGELTDSDRKNLAKALSGFANADGGLIVWGVECKRDDDGVDAASELRPIRSLARALSDLKSVAHQAVNPSVPGVEHRPIEREDGTGFIVTLVPASDGGPHMAKLSEDRYYRRSGDAFRKMEHFEIADMFGRRARPVLSLVVEATAWAKKGSETEFRCLISIINTGRAVAIFPAVVVTADRDVVWPTWGSTAMPYLPTADTSTEPKCRKKAFAGTADYVVHVNTGRLISEVFFTCDPSSGAVYGFGFSITAQDCPPLTGRCEVTPEQMLAAIRAKA